MLVRELMRTEVVTAEPKEAVREAAQRMADNHVGSLVVTSGGRVVGMLTERDVLAAFAEHGEELAKMEVEEVMSRDIVGTTPSSGVEAAAKAMQEHGVKRMPVLLNDRLVGILTASDVLQEMPKLRAQLERVVRKRRI